MAHRRDTVTLKELREQRFLTVADLAKRLGVSTQTIYHWEAGTHKPLLSHRKKLVEALGIEALEHFRG